MRKTILVALGVFLFYYSFGQQDSFKKKKKKMAKRNQ